MKARTLFATLVVSFVAMSSLMATTASAAVTCQDFSSFPTATFESSPVTAPTGHSIHPDFDFYINSIYPPYSSQHYDFAQVGMPSTTFLFGYYGGQYEIEWASTDDVIEVVFDLVHFNVDEIEVTAYGEYFDISTFTWKTGYLRDSGLNTIQDSSYNADSGTPGEGVPYTVTVDLANFQKLHWIQVTPVGNEGGIIEVCVEDV